MNKILISLAIIFCFLFSNLFSEIHQVQQPTREAKQKTKKRNWRPWVASIVSIIVVAEPGVYLAKNNHEKCDDCD